jgi:hypothetical protein
MQVEHVTHEAFVSPATDRFSVNTRNKLVTGAEAVPVPGIGDHATEAAVMAADRAGAAPGGTEVLLVLSEINCHTRRDASSLRVF